MRSGEAEPQRCIVVRRNIQAIIERFELPSVIKRGNRRPKPIADSGSGSETVSDQGTGQEIVAK